MRNHDRKIPTQLLTTWCNHPRRRSSPLKTSKKKLSKKISRIVPSSASNSRLSTWAYLAIESYFWKHLISHLGAQPTDWNSNVSHPDNPPPIPHDHPSAQSIPPRHKFRPMSSSPVFFVSPFVPNKLPKLASASTISAAVVIIVVRKR